MSLPSHRTARHVRAVAAFYLASVLVGGGCGGGSEPRYSVEVSPSRIEFVVAREAELPAVKTLTATYEGDGVVVGYPVGVEPPAWIDAYLLQESAGSITVAVGVTTTSLAQGEYSTTLRFVTGKADGSHLVYKDVPVTYRIGAGLSCLTASLAFEAPEGVVPAHKAVQLASDTPVDWSLTVRPVAGGPADWLVLDQTSGMFGGASTNVGIGVAARAPGHYAATLEVRSGGVIRATVPVTYDVTSNLAVVPGALAFEAVEGFAPVAQTLTFTAVSVPAAFTVAVEPVGDGPTDWVRVSATSGTVETGPVSVSVGAHPRGPGRHVANLVLRNAAGEVRGTVPLTYQVAAAAALSTPAAVTVRESSGWADLEVPITLETRLGLVAGAACTWTATASASWLVITPAGGDLSADVPLVAHLDPEALWTFANGAHAADVTVTFASGCATGASTPVTVDLALAPAFAAIPEVRWRVGFGTTPDALGRTASVAHNLGAPFAPHGGWHASGGAAWLGVETGSGAGAGSLALALVPAGLAALGTGEHDATVSIVPDSPRVAGVQLKAVVTMALPEIEHVAPYVTWVNRSQRIVVRGRGFSGQATLPVTVGAEVAPAEVVSDTELRLTAPAQGVPGRLPVFVSNPLGLERSASELVIRPEPSFAGGVVPLDHAFAEIVFDPERDAVLLLDQSGELRRLRMREGAWVSDSYVRSSLSGVAVSLDGRALIASSGNVVIAETFERLDPETFAVQDTKTWNDSYGQYRHVLGLNDGRTLIVDADQWAESVWYPSMQEGPRPELHSASALVTRDRSRALLLGGGPAWVLDASATEGRTGPAGIGSSWNTIGISEDGGRLVSWDRVYDRDLQLLGNVQLPGYLRASTVAPNGDYYTLCETGQGWVLHRTDLGAAQGPYSPDAAPLPLGPWGYYESVTSMRVSEDGGTLFLLSSNAGVSMLRVIPLP